MTQNTRKLRVGAEMHRLLNELLHTEVKDPRLFGVTVNEVEMSGDLGVAKVYYSMLDPEEDPEEARDAFRKANGFLRGRIGQALRLRRTPELQFIRDVSARRGEELTRLMDSLREERSRADDADDEAADGDDEAAHGDDEAAGGGDRDEPPAVERDDER